MGVAKTIMMKISFGSEQTPITRKHLISSISARPARDSQDGLDGASQQEAAPLFLPELNQLHEFSFVRGEDVSNVVDIPTHYRVT